MWQRHQMPQDHGVVVPYIGRGVVSAVVAGLLVRHPDYSEIAPTNSDGNSHVGSMVGQ